MKRLYFVGLILILLAFWVHTPAPVPAQTGSASGGALPNTIGGLQDMVGFNKGSLVTQWNLQQAAASPYTTEDARGNPPSLLGVAENVGASVVSVITRGQTLMNMAAAPVPTVGHTVCTGSIGGLGVDSGGSNPCPSGTMTIGTVLAVTTVAGLPPTLWDGVPFQPSLVHPLVDFRISPAATPGKPTLPFTCEVVPLNDTIPLVGTVAETPFTTTCTVPGGSMSINQIVNLQAWFDVTSGTTSPLLSYKAYYGGSLDAATGAFTRGTLFANILATVQVTSNTRTAQLNLVLATPGSTGTTATLFATGSLIASHEGRNSLQSAILHAQDTATDKKIYLTVSSTGGTAGSKIQLLSLGAR